MREVGIRTLRDIHQKGALLASLGEVNLVPAHMGQLEAPRIESRDRAGKNAEARHPTATPQPSPTRARALGAPLEEQVKSQADA